MYYGALYVGYGILCLCAWCVTFSHRNPISSYFSIIKTEISKVPSFCGALAMPYTINIVYITFLFRFTVIHMCHGDCFFFFILCSLLVFSSFTLYCVKWCGMRSCFATFHYNSLLFIFLFWIERAAELIATHSIGFCSLGFYFYIFFFCARISFVRWWYRKQEQKWERERQKKRRNIVHR